MTPFGLRRPWRAFLIAWHRLKVRYLRWRLRRIKPRDRAERRQAERIAGKRRSFSKSGRRPPLRA